MKTMLGMLVNLLESLDQIVKDEAKLAVGTLRDLFTKLSGKDGELWWEMLKKFLRKEACWVEVASGVKAATAKILRLVTSVEVGAVTEFVAKEHFRTGQTVDGVKYTTDFGSNFKAHFLPKTERNVEAGKLRVHELLQRSKDLGIRAEIGEDREEATLAHLHQLLKLQGRGQKEGVLLVDGSANIFYIIGTDGNLWAVCASWYVAGWYLCAFSVQDQFGWLAGCQVFSR